MFKAFFLGIQIFSLFFLGFFQTRPVEMTDDLPASIAPGEESIVTVSIEKSDVSGFAKYQLTLGPGLTAEPVELAGASFTFNEGQAKYIWMSLPESDKFDISYRLIADENASGTVSVNARFSYIFDNERKNVDAVEKTILIGEGEIADGTESEGDTATPPTEADDVIPSDGTETAGVSRTITPDESNQWTVQINIADLKLDGFAKVEETIPEGYTAIDLKSSGAAFTSDGQTVKYIWYDIPHREVVSVIYKLLPVIAVDGESPMVTGTFNFLQNQETIEIPITEEGYLPLAVSAKDTSGAEVTDMAALEEPEEPEEPEAPEAPVEEITETEHPEEKPAEETAEAAGENAATAQEPTQEPTAEQPEPEETTTAKAYTDANIVGVPAPEEGVYYRVQIAAGKNNLKREVFVKLYKFDEGFKLEHTPKWFKYTTGHHSVYKQARNDRVRITDKYSKFQGPFVTAYNDGERITVQEALMITAQKWVP